MVYRTWVIAFLGQKGGYLEDSSDKELRTEARANFLYQVGLYDTEHQSLGWKRRTCGESGQKDLRPERSGRQGEGSTAVDTGSHADCKPDHTSLAYQTTLQLLQP